jgi:hypothetical protein
MLQLCQIHNLFAFFSIHEITNYLSGLTAYYYHAQPCVHQSLFLLACCEEDQSTPQLHISQVATLLVS